MAIYYNPEFKEENIDMEAAVNVAAPPTQEYSGSEDSEGKFEVRDLPGADAVASTVHRGQFEGVVDAIIALYDWLGTNDYSASSPYREIHLLGREIDPFDSDNVIHEAQLPVTSGRTGPG